MRNPLTRTTVAGAVLIGAFFIQVGLAQPDDKRQDYGDPRGRLADVQPGSQQHALLSA